MLWSLEKPIEPDLATGLNWICRAVLRSLPSYGRASETGSKPSIPILVPILEALAEISLVQTAVS